MEIYVVRALEEHEDLSEDPGTRSWNSIASERDLIVVDENTPLCRCHSTRDSPVKCRDRDDNDNKTTSRYRLFRVAYYTGARAINSSRFETSEKAILVLLQISSSSFFSLRNCQLFQRIPLLFIFDFIFNFFYY